jgi:ATP-dependent DNA helicase RecG
MSRLIQGDVGCGKTAVAFGAVWLAAQAGFQSSMMAPTEILAVQHYENACKTLDKLGIRCRLLTGSTKARERRIILQELKEHQCDAVFGTHALISRDVEYSKLGLVITDEQHRFGVNQRTTLQLKGETEGTVPHVLVMSATPIPRTLALILYGDLDLSVIDEMPLGRIPVKTRLVPEYKRNDMYAFLRNEISRGRQAYIVCPLVEEDEEQHELRSAKELFESLQNNELKGLKLGLTWGSQKADDKNKVLHDFAGGAFDVLVSTTVIEVGVNNPNATIMVIENADRYGLSQLHQLRGRVGRGSEASWCFLFAEPSEKLRVFCSINDGFMIAQKDLELRGPGDLIGTRQSGEIGSQALFSDIRLLDEVTQCIKNLRRDPSQRTELAMIEQYAKTYFDSEGHHIALN